MSETNSFILLTMLTRLALLVSSNCEPRGCHYYSGENVTKLIECEQDGSRSVVIFPGENECDEWTNPIIEYYPHDACCTQLIEQATESPQQALIVGGTVVNINEYPFMAAIIEYGQFQCGASILRKEYPALILTAAHCHPAFDSQYTMVQLYADYINDPNAINSKITHYEIHPNYNENIGEKYDYDIAILWLETDISEYDQLETVVIHPIISDNFECCIRGDDLELIGYGYDLDGLLTPTLEKIDVNYIDRFVCRFAHSNEDITENMNCASEPNKSACNGDSGSPLVVKDTNQQIGIVSWLVSDCQDYRPNVFTDVSVLKPWIDIHLIINPSTTETAKPCK